MTLGPCAATRGRVDVSPRTFGLQRHTREGLIRYAYAHIGRVMVMVPPVSQVMPYSAKRHMRGIRIVPMLNRNAPGTGKARLRGLPFSCQRSPGLNTHPGKEP